ncbi:hypothetical protein CYMTET_26769 [Cymbomonas tetramitiformis]|uniref:Uncharacterized protein n=1 Tax=Cymbomonas tetramitiformis TaxID=36881 RepID=A0AAE0KXL4_9CHLO|nr:hypothetical protein CYMTET_26769 [Cymbomonas tetramitiformis]
MVRRADCYYRSTFLAKADFLCLDVAVNRCDILIYEASEVSRSQIEGELNEIKPVKISMHLRTRSRSRAREDGLRPDFARNKAIKKAGTEQTPIVAEAAASDTDGYCKKISKEEYQRQAQEYTRRELEKLQGQLAGSPVGQRESAPAERSLHIPSLALTVTVAQQWANSNESTGGSTGAVAWDSSAVLADYIGMVHACRDVLHRTQHGGPLHLKHDSGSSRKQPTAQPTDSDSFVCVLRFPAGVSRTAHGFTSLDAYLPLMPLPLLEWFDTDHPTATI